MTVAGKKEVACYPPNKFTCDVAGANKLPAVGPPKSEVPVEEGAKKFDFFSSGATGVLKSELCFYSLEELPNKGCLGAPEPNIGAY